MRSFLTLAEMQPTKLRIGSWTIATVCVLVFSLAVHEGFHLATLLTLGVSFDDIYIGWFCGSGPCVNSRDPVIGLGEIVFNYIGGLGSALVLILVVYLPLMMFPQFRRWSAIGGAIVAFMIGFQISWGLIEGLAHDWYLDPANGTYKGLLYFFAGWAGIALHIYMTGIEIWKAKLAWLITKRQ